MQTRQPNMTGALPQGADPPLWQKLQYVASVVMAVRQGTSTSHALGQTPAALRPGVQALSFQVLRNLGRAQALLAELASRAPPPATDALLCSSLALAWSDERAPFDVHTLVNQTVEAAKRQPATKAQANFINACLRRFLRERDGLINLTNQSPTALWNHPLWWIKRLQTDHPTNWQDILTANNQPAPMTLRVNQIKLARDDYLAQLESGGMEARSSGRSGVTLAKAHPVSDIPGFAEGWVSVQDAAAQLAAPLLLDALRPAPGLSILDACAAPGGKTAHLLEIGSGTVTSIDIDAQRVGKIRETLTRLGLTANVVVGDAATPEKWSEGAQFDAILLDAPCTASGIVRRHPDVRWLRRESDIEQLARVQARLLKALWPLVKPGGRLLYCTCSVFHAEGSLQAQTFLAHNRDATLLPSPGHLLPHFGANQEGVPDNSGDDHDGFFLALFEKRAA
jgi:16S rRNA (cytosine967-C5)-methyltransferase